MATPDDLDERLRFLVQSTESLHASAQELHAIAAEHTAQLREHSAQRQVDAKRLDKLLTVTETLAAIAESREQRLTNLEGPPTA